MAAQSNAQQTFEELVAAVKQAESRGKRYAADGKTLTTSPKGALGEMQVMPKTIKDPGFGVTPAKSSSPDEIARVGVDYLQAMKQRYGDTEKALIAYNWGPGSTDKWIASGADPKKLPEETRTYVQRVKGFLGKDVSRETMAKKDREPLPASLPPMAKAPESAKTTTVAKASVPKLDMANMPASYKAAFALAALADAQDEEDDRVFNEFKETESEKLMRDYKPVNYLASLDLSVQPIMMAEGGEVEDLTKPYFGNPNVRKQGEAARRLAAMRDVNTLPDPKTYAAVTGVLGTPPDKMGFSVMHPKYREIMDVANPAFAAGTALQIAPVAQGPGMGRMVGAAEKALEPAVRRTLEGGGKAAEMLQALAAPPSQMFVRARPEAAARHADLQAKGLSPEEIRAQNLTMVDNRGNLLEEISDAPATLKQKTASVPRMYYDMLKHPELQSIYPGYDMPDVLMGTTKRKNAPLASASFDEREGIRGTVRDLPGDDARNTVRGTLLHEGQHAIQSMEGFTEGANPSAFVAYIKAKRGTYHSDPTVNENVIREMERAYPNLPEVTDRIGDDLKTRYGKVFPSDKRVGEALYRHMPGEVQAELARVRSNLSPEQLKATPLETSMQQLNINPANILEMNKMGSRPDRQIGDLEYDVYGYARGGPVYRAEGSPEEGEIQFKKNKNPSFNQRLSEAMAREEIGNEGYYLRDSSTTASKQLEQLLKASNTALPASSVTSRALPPRYISDNFNAAGWTYGSGPLKGQIIIAGDIPVTHDPKEVMDRVNTQAHEAFHQRAGEEGRTLLNRKSYSDDLARNQIAKIMREFQPDSDVRKGSAPNNFGTAYWGLRPNRSKEEQIANLAGYEGMHPKGTSFLDTEVGKRMLKDDPRLIDYYFTQSSVPYGGVWEGQVKEPGMIDNASRMLKKFLVKKGINTVNRAKGGEAEPTAEELAAASTPAFIAQKSGIGRKAGPVSRALQSGQGPIEFLKGMTNIPQNLVGAPMDISNMIANVYGGGVEKPFMGSDYIKEGLRAKGLGFTPPTDPTLAAFYGAGDLGSNLVNPAGATRAGVQAAGKTGEAAKMLARDFQQYNQELAVPGASYAVRNKGTPVAMTGLPFLSKVDEAEFLVKGVIGNGKQPLESTDKSLSDWFSKKVTRYLRSDFASPQDQLVKAAEEGKALHLAPKEFSDSAEDEALKHFLGRRQSDLEYMRQAEGFGKSNMATTPYGQRIEDITDISAYPERVEDLTPDRVPPSMRNLVETRPETRVTDFAPNMVNNLKLNELRDKMLEVRQAGGTYGAYGQPAVKIPSEFLLPDKTLSELNVAAASNRMARYTNWQNDTRQRMATTALRADPAFPRAQLQDGKFIGVALPDVKKNPEMKQLVTDVGCDGGWCTRYTPNAEAYASGFSRLHVIVTGEGKQARPVAQFAIADNGPSYDTKRFSITEVKEKGNTADFANNPALPAIQQYIQHLDKTYGGLGYVDNLDGLRMTQLPEYPNQVLNFFDPSFTQKMDLGQKFGNVENGMRAVRDKAVELNNGSRFVVGNDTDMGKMLQEATKLLVPTKQRMTMEEIKAMIQKRINPSKATGGMIERQPDDNRRYL